MRNYILFIIIIILLFSINSCNSKKEDNLIKILAIALGMAPADSGVTGSGNTSETQPNPSDDSFYNNTPGVNPNDTTDFGAGGNVVPPTTPPGPSSPPPIGPSVPFGDTNPVITAQVLKTPTIVDRYQDIIIEFSENMKRDSVCLGENSGNLTITNISNNDRSCRWATDKQLLIRHYKPLDPLTDYTITISGGAVSLFDSSRSFSNFTNPTASGNTFTFKTEPEHKVSFTINFDGANYTVDNSKGLNLATNSAANSTITVTSINNSIGADIIQLKKIGSDDVYEVCNGGCSTTIFSGFNLSVNSSLPSSLLVTTGMNSYLLIIKSRVTTNPEQFKNYYRTFNFNYGNHSINPMTYQYNTGSLVLEKGQPHWSLLGSSGSSQGTLDVLAFFLEHFAEKSFTLKSNYSGSPIVETFNQILQREMKNTLPATNCYVPSNNTYANCPLFNDPDNSIIASKRADPYGVFPASQEGLPYVPNHPILPFSYFTRVGPFTKLQLPNGDDGLYYLDNLQEVTSGSISSGIDELVRNNIALPGFIADIAANVLDWLIAGILDVVVGILNGVGKVGGENYPSSLRLRYNFFADAYPNQAVVGKATKSLLKTDAILTPDSNHEPELINPIIDISGNDLIVKMNARELHAALMLAMDLQKLQIELYFLDFVNYSFPISINISTDILDWFDEICVVDICGPDLTSPKWPPPISFQIHMNWYTMGFLSGVTDLLKGFYIFRVYADLDSSTTNTAMYANEYPSSYPPGFPKPYAESNIIGTANVDASSLLRLYVPNPIYGAGGITATDWYNGLQGTIGTSALPNPAVLASTTDLGNAKNSMDSVTTGNIVERIMWDVLRALLADPGAALVNGIVSAILSDALLQAFPYVKPFIVNALLNDIIKNIATDIFNAILDPLKKGVKLSMPDFTPAPIKDLILNLGIRLTPSKSNLIQTHTNRSKGIVVPIDLKLVATNNNFTGENCNYGTDDINGNCPPEPNGNTAGKSSFVRTRNFSNWSNSSATVDLPNPLEYSYNNPGALLGIHPDAISQFFFSLWKNGGLNMKIDNSFLGVLEAYRPTENNEPVKLLKELLKPENLLGVLVPSGVVDTAISGDSNILLKAYDSSTGTYRNIYKTDKIFLKLFPMQAPFVSVDSPLDANDYVPLLNLTLSDVEVQIYGVDSSNTEYRILAFRLNLNTRAELRAGAFNGTPQKALENPNMIALKLDICNDTLGEYQAGNPAIDCDFRNTQFGTKNFTSYSISVPELTWNGETANPLGLNPTGIGNILGAVTKTVLIPVFNYILGEIPLHLLGHCGIEVNQKYRKDSNNSDNVKILPIKANSSEPFFLINARTEIYDNSTTTGSGFDSIPLTTGVPPRFQGMCDLIAP